MAASGTGRAKQRKSPSVKPSDTMDTAGRKVMRFYLDGMLGHERGVLDGWDIEALHDMRVATRRLRVAFRLFRRTFGRKTLTPFLRQCRQLGRNLGRVRDLDVFLEFVDEYAQEHDNAGAFGMVALRTRLEMEREEPRSILADYLQQKPYTRFKQAFRAWINGKTKYKPKKTGKRPVRQVVPELLNTQRTVVLDYETQILNDPASETLHNLRIACKQMRYTADFFRACYKKKRLSPLRERMTELQDFLGRVHDADVHVDYVRHYIGALDRRSSLQRVIQADLETLIESEHRVRQASLDKFHTVWPTAVDEIRGLDFAI